MRRRYANEYSCPVQNTQLRMLGGHRYRVTGCGGSVVYQCVPGVCWSSRESEGTSGREAPVSAQTSYARASSRPGVRRAKHVDGYTIIGVDVELANATLQMRAAPERSADVSQVSILTYPNKLKDCNLMLMVNGQKVAIDPSTYKKERSQDSLTVRISRTLLLDMGSAQQLAFRACDERWTVGPQQRAQIAEFVSAVEEDLAWAGDARKGSTGGLLAPASGWVAWGPPSRPLAPPISGRAMEGDELYKKLAPSVYKIEAVIEGGTSQGSAVAVTTTDLITNCHVVAGGKRLTAKQGSVELSVKLSHSDPETDRCILTVEGTELQPVTGVRAFTDLKVGESVYTLGSPQGLEATLASGIISGLRDHEKEGKLVQTTAPISPGSSGGGLFDARGNLIGITQMVRVDSERISQALNFAIPADAYWK